MADCIYNGTNVFVCAAVRDIERTNDRRGVCGFFFCFVFVLSGVGGVCSIMFGMGILNCLPRSQMLCACIRRCCHNGIYYFWASCLLVLSIPISLSLSTSTSTYHFPVISITGGECTSMR